MRSLMRFISLTVVIASATLAHADTLQIFWDGPTSFTFDIPSQFIVSLAVPGLYVAGSEPCLFSGVAATCGVTFVAGGPSPFPGLVVNAPVLGYNGTVNLEGLGLFSVTVAPDLSPLLLAGYLNIPTGNYTVQMQQIITSLTNTAPGILYVTDLSIPPAIPEPSTFALLGTGILCLVGAARRRRSTNHDQALL
jgi:PEP-CTERM motif